MTAAASRNFQPRRQFRLFKFVRVRLSRKLWGTYRVCLRQIVSHVLGAMLLAIGLPVLAGPSGGQVVSGQAQITTPTAQSTVVNQGTQKAVINWQTFGIAGNETVQFVQPSSSSVVLNRIVGNDPSRIYGSLTANGQVFLVNAQGVYFSPTARVDTGALLASSLALSNADFNTGHYRLTGTSGGEVRNEGAITVAPGGYALLVGPRVANSGTITADSGSVGLLAGSRVSVDVAGDRLVSYSVDEGALQAAVANAGTIQANGGSVSLMANALNGALSTVVNHSGVIRANSVAAHNGVVTLRAIGGDTVVTGSIDASGAGVGQSGGSVQVLGERVGLFGSASIDASGAAGGGNVLVGGGYQGQGEVKRANQTVVGSGATINASALNSGHGGQVVIWADRSTQFDGSITARGGVNGGNGGSVETSGKDTLSVLVGRVDVGASAGRGGTWLLDPNDLAIKNNGGSNANTTGTFDANNTGAVLDVAVLGAALTNGTTVVVRTNNNNGNAGTGKITVSDTTTAALTAGQSATLTLAAQGDIVFNAGASITAGAADRSLSVNLHAGSAADGSSPGGNVSAIAMAATSSINAGQLGSVAAIAKGDIALGGLTINGGNLSVTSNGGNVTQTAPLKVGLLTTIDAGAGNVMLADPVNDFVGAVTATAGGVTLADTNNLTLAALTSGTNKIVSLIAGATLTLPATPINTGTADLTLRSNGGALATPGALTGKNITLFGRDGLAVNANVSAGGNLVLGSTNSAITQAAGKTITVTGNTTATSGTGNVTLAQDTNDFTGPVGVTGTGTADVHDANDLAVTFNGTGVTGATAGGALGATLNGTGGTTLSGGSVSSAGTSGALTISSGSTTSLGASMVAGDLNVTSGTNVTQTAAITVNGTSTIASTAGDILLGNSGNDFMGMVTATAAMAGKDITVVDANDLSIALTAGGAGSATATKGALVISGSIGTTLETTSGTTTKFGGTSVGTTLSTNAGGEVNQVAESAVKVQTKADITAGGSITLDSTANNFFPTADAGATNVGATFKTSNSLTFSTASNAIVNINDVQGNATITTGNDTIRLLGNPGRYNGGNLALNANNAHVVLTKESADRYVLGAGVVGVETSLPTRQDVLQFFAAENGTTVIDGIPYSALEQLRAVGVASVAAVQSDQDRRQQEDSAGIGHVNEALRLNAITFEELIAPLTYKKFSVKSAPCSLEQSSGKGAEGCSAQGAPRLNVPVSYEQQTAPLPLKGEGARAAPCSKEQAGSADCK